MGRHGPCGARAPLPVRRVRARIFRRTRADGRRVPRMARLWWQHERVPPILPPNSPSPLLAWCAPGAAPVLSTLSRGYDGQHRGNALLALLDTCNATQLRTTCHGPVLPTDGRRVRAGIHTLSMACCSHAGNTDAACLHLTGSTCSTDHLQRRDHGRRVRAPARHPHAARGPAPLTASSCRCRAH